MSKDTPKIQHAYCKGTADGEICHGLLHSNRETSAVFINNRAHPSGKHYIAMYKTGEDHLKDGTVCRSTGGFYVRAGDAIKSGEDNGDQAPDISENVPAVYLEAITNDLVLSAPLGKIRIFAQQIELVPQFLLKLFLCLNFYLLIIYLYMSHRLALLFFVSQY